MERARVTVMVYGGEDEGEREVRTDEGEGGRR